MSETVATTSTDDMLLWLDLETTGSSVEHDSIIEVGAVLTTTNLTEVAEFSIVIDPSDEALGRMLRCAPVKEMHEANGLLAEVLAGTGRKPHDAANALLTWLEENGAKQGRTVLAGSGVAHFDRRFIDRYMPQVSRFLRYWVIDIGVIRRAHGMWVGTEASTANDAKTHRALDDVRCHIEEAQAFRDLWRGDGNGSPAAPGFRMDCDECRRITVRENDNEPTPCPAHGRGSDDA